MEDEKQLPASASLQEVAAFLNGSGPLEGVWFGEKPATEKGNFWWRKHLRSAIEQAIATANGVKLEE